MFREFQKEKKKKKEKGRKKKNPTSGIRGLKKTEGQETLTLKRIIVCCNFAKKNKEEGLKW